VHSVVETVCAIGHADVNSADLSTQCLKVWMKLDWLYWWKMGWIELGWL
jgi:hypothetical protein